MFEKNKQQKKHTTPVLIQQLIIKTTTMYLNLIYYRSKKIQYQAQLNTKTKIF